MEVPRTDKATDFEHDRYFLKRLTSDFTACHYIDVDAGTAEILKVAGNTNAQAILGEAHSQVVSWVDLCEDYACRFIAP